MRSLLFGTKQFIIHPIFVLVAWLWLFGKPRGIQMVAIIIHEWGHLYASEDVQSISKLSRKITGFYHKFPFKKSAYWYDFFASLRNEILYSVIYMTVRDERKPSFLFYADRMAVAFYPRYLFWILAVLGGERKKFLENKNGIDPTSIKSGKLSLLSYHRRFRFQIMDYISQRFSYTVSKYKDYNHRKIMRRY